MNFRTYNNLSIFKKGDLKLEFWGNCKDECNGEMPEPDSEYNIAKDDDLFNSVWSEGLYDLRQFEAGYCFTYDPPQQSGSGVTNGLYILLGHKDLLKDFSKGNIERYARDSSYMMYSFDIYLHDKVDRMLYCKCIKILHIENFRDSFGPKQIWKP